MTVISRIIPGLPYGFGQKNMGNSLAQVAACSLCIFVYIENKCAGTNQYKNVDECSFLWENSGSVENINPSQEGISRRSLSSSQRTARLLAIDPTCSLGAERLQSALAPKTRECYHGKNARIQSLEKASQRWDNYPVTTVIVSLFTAHRQYLDRKKEPTENRTRLRHVTVNETSS